jgi:hypothetical protein
VPHLLKHGSGQFGVIAPLLVGHRGAQPEIAVPLVRQVQKPHGPVLVAVERQGAGTGGSEDRAQVLIGCRLPAVPDRVVAAIRRGVKVARGTVAVEHRRAVLADNDTVRGSRRSGDQVWSAAQEPAPPGIWLVQLADRGDPELV